MKKTLSVILSLVLALTMLSAVAFAEEEPMEISWLAALAPLEDNSWGETTFNETFNVKVDIKRAESDDERAVLFASGDIPDYINNTNNLNVVAGLVDQGIIRPITLEMIQENMPEYYEMCIAQDPNFFTYGIVDGEIYAVPRYSATSAPLAGTIRADWLRALDLQVPTTVEELTDVFTKFTFNDPDGNGVDDTYAITAGGAASTDWQRVYFPSIFGIYHVNPYYWTENENGELEFGFVSEGSKKALTLLADWYAKGLIDPEFVTTELRTSGTDVASKFCSGKVGYMDSLGFDDYEWDNDGHVSAKWVANSPEWQAFFASTDDTAVLYQYDTTTDFSEALEAVGPYYINMNPVKDEEGNQGAYPLEGNVGAYLTFGAMADDAKVAKIMQILNQEATDEETYMLHFGPAGIQYIYDEDGVTRIFNPEYTSLPEYHPQGQILGSGWCLFPMYFSNPDLLTAVAGDRYVQRYDRVLPMFRSFPSFDNKLKASLPAAVEYPEATTTFVSTNLVKIVRGEISIDDWDKVVEDWMDNGGRELTEQANEWWASVK